MSYLSGFMMGAAIGKGVRQFLSGTQGLPRTKDQTKSAPFVLVSAQSGRRRYRAALLSCEFAKLLEEKLGELSFVKSVEVNAATGSILFLYDAKYENKMDAVAAFLARRIFVASAPKSTVTNLAAPVLNGKQTADSSVGSITASVRRTMSDFSAFIKRHTGGMLDAKSLAAALLLLRGVRKMILTRQYPSGSAMLWWAVSLMRGWRTI